MSEFEKGEAPTPVTGAESVTPPLTLDQLDAQVLALSKFELECLVKTYFKALHQISEVECKEGSKWCYEDAAIECEHNVARKALGEF